MLMPDATRVPLRVAAKGTSLVIDRDGPEWIQVTFNDPQVGLRQGYIQAKFVQREAQIPADLSVPGAKPSTVAPTPKPLQVVTPAASPSSRQAAPTRLGVNSVIYIEESEFGQALSGALVKKKVPILVTTSRDKATFYMEETSKAEKEGTGERVTKVIAFGVFAGSGKSYEASVRLTNADGIVLFAHNSRKSNARSAAEEVAKTFGQYIKQQAKAN